MANGAVNVVQPMNNSSLKRVMRKHAVRESKAVLGTTNLVLAPLIVVVDNKNVPGDV